MPRPSLFVGSSSEGRRVAEAVQLGLDPVCEVELWTQGIFRLTQGTLESLIVASDHFDFAVLVLTADDLTISRGAQKMTARDNILFELGLFIGALGRERTFMLYDRTHPPVLPSDLAGITAATFAPHASGNLEAALGAPCTKIRRVIDLLGIRNDRNSGSSVEVPAAIVEVTSSSIQVDEGAADDRGTQKIETAEISVRIVSQERLASVSGQGNGRRDWFLVLSNTGVSTARDANFELEAVHAEEKPWVVLHAGAQRELLALSPLQEARFPILVSAESAQKARCLVSWTDELGFHKRTVLLQLN